MNPPSELDEQRRRAAKNESLFREVNERIEDRAEAVSGGRFGSAAFVRFVCECSDETCRESVSLTVGEYEHVRSDSNSFIVVPGHHVPDVEAIVESSDRYLVVKKLGAGRHVAEELDPRQ